MGLAGKQGPSIAQAPDHCQETQGPAWRVNGRICMLFRTGQTRPYNPVAWHMFLSMARVPQSMVRGRRELKRERNCLVRLCKLRGD